MTKLIDYPEWATQPNPTQQMISAIVTKLVEIKKETLKSKKQFPARVRIYHYREETLAGGDSNA